MMIASIITILILFIWIYLSIKIGGNHYNKIHYDSYEFVCSFDLGFPEIVPVTFKVRINKNNEKSS
jgi:hypothetical protein